jgi:hypothetical protein
VKTLPHETFDLTVLSVYGLLGACTCRRRQKP